MNNITILCGIPCSGKSTYAEKRFDNEFNSFVVCRDTIRENYFKQPYIYSIENENDVTNKFSNLLKQYLSFDNTNVILDNTHCKEKYIDEIINKYPNCNIIIKFFEISLLKAHYRNIVRYFKTGKWIPFSVMNQMYKNYNKINKKKYTKYLEL